MKTTRETPMLFKKINTDNIDPPVVFVSLDITDDRYYTESSTYKLLSAKDKIALLQKGIIFACETLKQKELKNEINKDSMWIISWREHGISEAGSNYATIQTKALLTATMEKLTTTYQKLTIIAGTMKTKRHIDAKHQATLMQHIQKRYENLNDIKELERDSVNEQAKAHQLKFLKVMQTTDQTGLSVVRNTCYYFPGSYKRSKSAAWNEIDMDEKSVEIFYPGKTDNIASTLTLRNNKKINIGVEICYEHDLGVLQHTNAKKVFLHLILSDSTAMHARYLNGIHNIQIDSSHGVRFITSANKNDPKILVYQLDMNAMLIHDRAQLEGPLKPQKLFLNQISQGIHIADADAVIKDQIGLLDKQEVNELLSWAVYFSDEKLLIALFKYGVSVDTIVNGDTSLASAMEKDHSETDKTGVIKILLDHKADPAIKNDEGETPLHVGAKFNQFNKIKLLLSLITTEKQKAIINLIDNSGKSAAHIAAENSHDIETLKLLHEYGADLTLKDKDQKSPLDYLAGNSYINATEKNKFTLSLEVKSTTIAKLK
jgi:ankyrin repeat protein